MTANFTMCFAFYLLSPLLPLYLSEQFGAGKDVIGVVLSGYSLAALMVRPFSGYLADSFPRKKVLLLGGFLTEHISYRFAFWTIAVIHAAGALFFLVTKAEYLKRTIPRNTYRPETS